MALNLSRLSPASAFSYAVMDLTGTGFKGQQRFLQSVTDYRREFAKFVERKVFETMGAINVYVPVSQAGAAAEELEKATKVRVDVRDIPAYRQHEESLAESLRDAIVDLSILLFYNVLFFISAYVAFLRYDVR